MSPVKSGVVVVGAGLAGISAAVAAARSGSKVALINNRPVLGGNSSSEIRVWTSGASVGFNRYARETGITEEILLDNKYRNPEGNPHIWDILLLDKVVSEPNIKLYLNTHVFEVKMDRNRIIAVIGQQLGTEKVFSFEAPIFVDCSGDATVGYLAGAEYRTGREGRSEFGEPSAPDAPDNVTLGSSLLFYTKDVGRPVKFVAPSFARDMSQERFIVHKDPERKLSSKHSGCDYWWIEWGGELNTITNHQDITWELQRIVFGIWDYLKNSGQFDTENLTLEWVGSIAGKRESRRLIGDYILTENDILDQSTFEDAVAYGGWPIDLHPPEGIFSSMPACNQDYVSIYQIPLRSLYSVNIENLFFAGRNISATHNALASTRVMLTCSVMGQAVGTAAAICQQSDLSPRRLVTEKIDVLQQKLLEDDAYIPGLASRNPDDAAPRAKVSVSSIHTMEIDAPTDFKVLDSDYVFSIPVVSAELKSVHLLVKARGRTALSIEAGVSYSRPGLPLGDYECTHKIPVVDSGPHWIEIPVGLKGGPTYPWRAELKIKTNPELELGMSPDCLPGITVSRLTDDVQLPAIKELFTFCFRTDPEQEAFGPANLVNGYMRPEVGPNIWISDPSDLEPTIEFTWHEPVTISRIIIYFDSDLDVRVNNLFSSNKRAFPSVVSDYDILRSDETGNDHLILSVQGNYQRMRQHIVAPFRTKRVQVRPKSTNGSNRVGIYGIKLLEK